jgi:hypothetical protein
VVVDDALRGGGRSERVEPFLRYRMDEGKPTVVTMNNEVAPSRVLYSFFHEFTTVRFEGQDVRKLRRIDGGW